MDKILEDISVVQFAETKYRAMFELSSIGMALNDKNGKLLEVNQAYLDIVGYTAAEIHKLTFWDLTPKSYDEQEQLQLKSLKETKRYGPYEKEYIHKDGHLVPVLLNGVSITDSDNETYTWSYIQNISERKKIEEAMKLSRRVFTDTHEGIVITDSDNIIVDVNPSFCRITGYDREEAIGQPIRILNSGQQSPVFFQHMWKELNEMGSWQGEIWNRHKCGEVYAEFLTISTLKDSNENIVNYVGIFSDITQSKSQQQKLSQLAHYDALTGLPNRVLFADRFDLAVAHNNRSGGKLAVCLLDLDDFKPINDKFGHDVGDKLLVEVAERIGSCVRNEDTISRQGGDEFALLFNNIQSYSIFEETIERIHDSLSKPYLIDGHNHVITVSTGITLYPNDVGDIDTLIRHADQAMYQAKLAGKNHHVLFSPEYNLRAIQKYHQISEIAQALENKEFQLFYQPKVNMRTGETFGAEALIRWVHPTKGIISPLDFLPVIEGTDLELEVGNWVISSAVEQLEIWFQQGIKTKVSINISSNHLLSKTFITNLRDVLARHRTVNPETLQLEILESTALGDLNSITEVIHACQHTSLGIEVALDDFGTGYSSLTHLKNLPVNVIKIDQGFVRDMLDDPSDYAIIDGIIALASSFGRKVIAEGVENDEQGLMLLLMGCEDAQGYNIAKPMPSTDYLQWMESYSPNPCWLNSSNQYKTHGENKTRLFRLASEHWMSRFVENINSSPENVKAWPTMESDTCHCGSWIQQVKQGLISESENVECLKQAHEGLHEIANRMLGEYLDGDLKLAREGLPALQKAYSDMQGALDKFAFTSA